MPQLLLMRHGKAEQNDAIADRARRLTARGRRDSEAIGKTIVARSLRPDRILCSPATRTRETLAAIIAAMGDVPDVKFIDALYDAPGDYGGVIAGEGGSAERLLVIGHNPAVQETAVTLIGSGDGKVRGTLHEKFPTSAVAVVAFERPWAALDPLSGRLVAFLAP